MTVEVEDEPLIRLKTWMGEDKPRHDMRYDASEERLLLRRNRQVLRRLRTELGEKFRLLCLRLFQVPLLDMAETADCLRDVGKAHRKGVIVGIESGHDLVDTFDEVADELTFGATFVRVAEHIERGA